VVAYSSPTALDSSAGVTFGITGGMSLVVHDDVVVAPTRRRTWGFCNSLQPLDLRRLAFPNARARAVCPSIDKV
jgi:hypothetical protein